MANNNPRAAMELIVAPFHDSPAGDQVREYRLPPGSPVPRVGETVLLGDMHEMTVDIVIWQFEVAPDPHADADTVVVEIRGVLR